MDTSLLLTKHYDRLACRSGWWWVGLRNHRLQIVGTAELQLMAAQRPERQLVGEGYIILYGKEVKK